MKLILLLFLLCLLINNSKCGPEIFKFTSEPDSQTVNPGGSVTLSCVATGRSGITYSWYKLDNVDFPPSNSDLISGEIGTTYVVQAADVDESGEERLFQCKATAGSDVILSKVATVLYKLADNIAFDSNGGSYNVQRSIPNDLNDIGVYLYRLQCNPNADLDDVITNGEPYDVQWFKSGETGRVENNHKNMWTCYNQEDFSNYKVTLGTTGSDITVTTVKKYDLLIFNVQTTDAGVYSCKAVSRKNKQEVLLGTTDLTVGTQNNQYTIIPKNVITGYMVLAVDSSGKIRTAPKEGDEVLLMCGAACGTSSNNWNTQYQWKDSSGTEIATTRDTIVTLKSTGSVYFTCRITNSECNSKLSSAEEIVRLGTVGDAEFDPTLPFTFSKSPPEYMWYDTSDNSKSHNPFEIGCEGSYTSGNTNVVFQNSVLRVPNIVASSGDDVVYNFGSSFTSDKSGVYQCVMFNTPSKIVLYQQTTNVMIVAAPSAAITPTIISVSSESTATFTCTVGGYPVESVTITGPNNVNLDCMTTQTSGDVSCSSTDQSDYVVNVQNFKLEYAGDYTCTVETEWYKADNTAAIQNSAKDQVTLSFESTTTLTASANPANKGTTVTLTCTVKGNPAPTTDPILTKTGDSSNVAMTCSETSFTKVCEKSFSSVEFSDAGDYTCSGENTIDGVKKKSSSQLTLEIVGNAEATLTQNPTGPELDKGSSVTFTCKIEGNPLPTKLTLKKGDKVLKSYDATGGTDNDIITTTYDISYVHDINTLELDDTGNYICEGENDNGGPQTDEDSTILTVVSDVVVTMTSSTTTPTFGTAFTITCTATGGRKPHSVELQHGSKAIPASDLTCSSEGDYSEKCLYISTADYTSGGMYSCTGKNRVAGNAEKEDTKTITISVSKAVSVSLTPPSGTSVEITYGSTYTVTCNVDGGDKPHKVTMNVPDNTDDLTWQRDGQGDPLFTCSGEFDLSCEYQISTIAYSHEDDYTCTGYNKLPGSSTDATDSKTASLVVVKDVTVSLSVDPATTEINHGAEIKITCVADGGRIPYFLELSHTSVSSIVTKLVTYDSTTSINPKVTVDKTANTLTYIHTVAASDYEDNGSYSCLSKNRASNSAERDDKQSKEVIVVKNVEVETISNIEADFGTSFTFTFKLNGGRSPHSVILSNTRSTIFDWSENSNECTGTNELTCSKTVGDTDVNFGYDGDYTVTAKNRAKNDAVVTATKTFRVTVFKDVSATIQPSSDSTMTYHVNKTITCNVIGGLPPHKVDLILPNQVTKSWSKDGTGNSLICTGTHEKTCTYNFTPEYNSDGNYKCVGYNKVRSDEEKQQESTVVQLTTVRSTEVTISNKTLSVLTNGTVDVNCTIVGKPLVDISAVSWSHETLTDLDLSGNVTTVKGSKDDYTLVSTLSIVNPLTEYSGSFNCNVQAENDQVITKSVVVSINNREFLDAPIVTHNGGEAVEQNTDMSITCHVKGFPRPSATLIYKNLIDSEHSRTISGTSNIAEISPTSTEFEFQLSTSCDYSQYEFICQTQNTKYTDSRVLKESGSVEGPIVTGCENTLPVMIGGGVGGGVVFIAIVVIAVLCILKKVKSNRNKEYSPKNGTQIPNPAFGADPSYATVRETPGAIGYSHLNRPVGETTEDGYASIDQMNRQTGPGLVPAADAYATLDTVSNGRMGLKRQGSDAAYAALNRPAPGKEKRGVIRKYKPIASKPKSTFVPNKAADIELGEVNNSDQPEPTYATVNPATMKAKKTTSEKLPDLPPEVPIYGQCVINKHAPSEYADVTIPSSEYADITLPPPPPLPEGPVYSNMAETQGSVNDEDPVYAQVDMKSRHTKKPAAGEEEEDLPPDVPIYGTMGARTECDYPDEEEDPYATVEFVPKSQRKPPRPKTKEDASEGLYATITDFKVNSES